MISDIEECSSQPCQNEGTCNDQPNGYTCDCVDGYEGTHCETGITFCMSLHTMFVFSSCND